MYVFWLISFILFVLCFEQIGHSLISFKIAHGFTGTSLPSDALRHLTSLQELDFSNNKLTSMSDTSFHFLKNLRLLELHDNRIEQVMKGTFQVCMVFIL